MRGKIGFMAVVAVAPLVMAAGGRPGTVDTSGDTQPPASGAGGEQSNLLVQAFHDDPQQLGLDPIEPPDYAYDIVNVDTSQYRMDGTPRIAFAIQAPEFSWPATYNDAVKARQREAYPDIDLIISGTGLGETDTQVATIEDLLVQQPDALIITPLTDVSGPVEQAAAQGIPVVLCTGTAETDAYVTRVDRDNYLNGAIGAEWIARQIGGKGKIVMLGGPAGVPTAEARFEGSNSVFSQYPDIKILAEENTSWDAASGKEIMQALLTRFDDIDAVWADGGGQAVGAIEAFKDAGREIPPFTAEPLNGFLRLAERGGFPLRRRRIPAVALGGVPGCGHGDPGGGDRALVHQRGGPAVRPDGPRRVVPAQLRGRPVAADATERRGARRAGTL